MCIRDRWKEPRCPSKDEWIKKMWSMYTMEYSSAIRNDKYPPCASMWMELEGMRLMPPPQNALFFNFNYFLLEFDLPTYNTQCSSRQVPHSVSVTEAPHPPPTSPSTTSSSFPRVRSLSCSVSLSDISHSFFLLSPLFPFTIFYIPQMNETI